MEESTVKKMASNNRQEDDDGGPMVMTRLHHQPTAPMTNTNRRAKLEETLLFFGSAVGCTLGWTAVLSNLVYYTETLGVNSYLYLNLAIYGPLLPITVAQTLWDADFDRQFTSLRSFGVRGTIGFAMTLVSVICLAKATSLTAVSWWSLCLGTASGILHGALKQMASFVYPGCGRLAAAVTAGLQASAVAVLAVSLLITRPNDDNSSSSKWLYYFYGAIAILVGVCWLCFQRLMTHSRDVYRSMLRRDSSIQLSALGQEESDQDDEEEEEEENVDVFGGESIWRNQASLPEQSAPEEPPTAMILSADCSPTASAEEQHNHHQDDDDEEQLGEPLLLASSSSGPQSMSARMPTMKELFYHSWPLCLATFLTVASSMAVASWFNRVPSDHPNTLPQVLFYTRLFADLLSRPATLLLPQLQQQEETSNDNNNQKILGCLMTLVFARLAFVPFFFLYCTTDDLFPRSDVTMTLGVLGFAFSSGFTTTLVYQLAPRFCPTTTNDNIGHPNDDVLLKQTNLLNVCFSASVLLGLLGSLSLSGIPSPIHH